MRRIIVALGVLIIGGGIWILSERHFFWDSAVSEPVSQEKSGEDILYNKIRRRDISPKKNEKSIMNNNGLYLKKYQGETILAEELDLDALQNRRSSLGDINPETVWEIDLKKLSGLIPGNIVVFSIDGVHYPVKIDQKAKVYHDHIVLDGSYEDESILYMSVITIGDGNVQITLNTPQGAFESLMYQGKGFVYRTTAIEEARVDPSLSDTLEAPKVTSNGDLDIIPR